MVDYENIKIEFISYMNEHIHRSHHFMKSPASIINKIKEPAPTYLLNFVFSEHKTM